MGRVLLISMPFADARFASTALSLLKPLVEKEGFLCDILYLNIEFRKYCGKPEIYDEVAGYWMIGEWPFGAELFGPEWMVSERGKPEALQSILPFGHPDRGNILKNLVNLRPPASFFIQKCSTEIDWSIYDVIGFTSVYSQQVASLALALRIKERFPKKLVVFGGANCDGRMGKALLRLFPWVDWVFNGEADISFPKALSRWFEGQLPDGINGVFYRSGNNIVDQGLGDLPEIENLPYPDFDDYFHTLQIQAPELLAQVPLSLEFSRGCWWGEKSQCIFCGVNRKSLHFRTKSPERALSEITILTKKYGVKRVRAVDSNLNPHYLKTLLPELSNQVNSPLEELFFETKTNLTREHIHRLQQAGTRAFQPGIESFDTEILTYMRKGTTLLQNVQFLKWARDYGLKPTYNFLYGFPGENPEAYRRMTALVPLLVHLRPPDVVSPILLQRFSPLFDQADRWKLQDVQAYHGHRFFYPFEQKDLDELAYTFDYHFKNQCQIPTYFEPLRKELEQWRSLWLQHEPPLLAFDCLAENILVIYDTRPCRQNMQVELSGEEAYAYLACDERRGFGRIAEEVKKRVGGEYRGDEKLRLFLDGLVEQRFMLREGDMYLSLANDLKLLATHFSSTLAFLLLSDLNDQNTLY